MKGLHEACGQMVTHGSKTSGIVLGPIVHAYTVSVLAKYIDYSPRYTPPFFVRLAEANSRVDYVDLAEDSLMFSSYFQEFTEQRMGRGGVRYVRDIGQTCYEQAGMHDIVNEFLEICDVLKAVSGHYTRPTLYEIGILPLNSGE